MDFLVEYHNTKKTAAGEFDDDDLTKTEEEMDWTPASQTENMDEEEEKPPPPQHVTIILDVGFYPNLFILLVSK